MKPHLLLLLALTAAFPVRAEPPCWTMQPAHSRLLFTGDQAGAPAQGEFRKFQVTLCFQPATAEGHLSVTVDTGSLDTHNSRRDEVLKGADFFDVEQYPQAVYTAQRFQRLGDHRYRAEGKLKLRGVERPLPVTFDFSGPGRTGRVQGTAVIHRLDFGVGRGRWKDTQWVGNDVTLHLELSLTRAMQPAG